MQWEQDGQPELAELVEDAPHALGVISVLWPVDGGQDVSRVSAKPSGDPPRRCSSGSMPRVASTIGLPVRVIFPAGTPSLRRLATARAVGAQCTSASTPVTHLLISSGMSRSKGAQPGLDVDHRRTGIAGGLRRRSTRCWYRPGQRLRLVWPPAVHIAELPDHPAYLHVTSSSPQIPDRNSG